MIITIESTTKVVELISHGVAVEARLWEGHTDNGTPVHAYVTRIAPSISAELLSPAVLQEFAADLEEQCQPSADLKAIPLRLIL